MLALVALLSAFSLALGFLVMVAAMVLVWVLPPWRWFARLGSMFGALVLLTIGAGLGGRLDDGGAGKADAKPHTATGPRAEVAASPAAAEPVVAADFTGGQLDKAETQARSTGYATKHHDASDEARSIFTRAGWTVCFQKSDEAAKTIDFAAVKTDEPCPDRDGGPLPWPTMPDVVSDTYNVAVKDLKQSGIDLGRVTLDDVYLDIDTPSAESAAEDGDEWRVCFQSPDRGSRITSTTPVHLDLGKWTKSDTVHHCPTTKDATYKSPAGDPDHGRGHAASGDNSPPPGRSTSDSGESSSSSGGGNHTTVHPGAYCSPHGATGFTDRGTHMVCGPGSDGRNRWHS
jgi:hypothetical protein